jgi:hypothetical protein
MFQEVPIDYENKKISVNYLFIELNRKAKQDGKHSIRTGSPTRPSLPGPPCEPWGPIWPGPPYGRKNQTMSGS